MAIPQNTDWAKMRYIMLFIFTITALLTESSTASRMTATGKHKRQLYIEHLLNHHGSEIIDYSFFPERLNFNNNNGLYLPPPLVQQYPKKYHHSPSRTYLPQMVNHPEFDNIYFGDGRPEFLAELLDSSYASVNGPTEGIDPPHPKTGQLPLAPYMSLYLLFQNRHKENHKSRAWNDIFPPNGNPQQISSYHPNHQHPKYSKK